MGSDVLPSYLVCDVSLSMTDHLGELAAGLREFRGAADADPAVADRVLCAVLGFAERPRMVQRLYPLDEPPALPEPAADTGSNFGPAFALLRETIAEDVRTLESHRLKVHRPLVFFVSDGRPTDPGTWPAEYAALRAGTRPAMVAFGVGDADPEALGRIGTDRTFLGRDGVRLGTALIASVRWALPGG